MIVLERRKFGLCLLDVDRSRKRSDKDTVMKMWGVGKGEEKGANLSKRMRFQRLFKRSAIREFPDKRA